MQSDFQIWLQAVGSTCLMLIVFVVVVNSFVMIGCPANFERTTTVHHKEIMNDKK